MILGIFGWSTVDVDMLHSFGNVMMFSCTRLGLYTAAFIIHISLTHHRFRLVVQSNFTCPKWRPTKVP